MSGRVLIFWEKDFPYVDTAETSPQYIIEALPPVDSVRTAGIDELRKLLRRDSVDLLINPFGSAFPKAAFPEILEFLRAGGHLMNLGGAPFAVPVRKSGESFQQEIRQTAYHRKLMINQISPVDTSRINKYETLMDEPLLSGLTDEFSCAKVFELQVKFTTKDETPDEIGTTGCREAILRPLLHALDTSGGPTGRIAAPIVAIDHIFGSFMGGRWILANLQSDEPLRKEIIQRLALFALLGPTDFQVRPSFACYYPDERAALCVHINRFERVGEGPKSLSLFVKVYKDNITVTHKNVEISDFRPPYHGVIPVEIPLSPGLYQIEARLSASDSSLTEKYASYYRSGFWCYDNAMVSMTQPLSAGNDFFMRETASPVVGTTYMASDVHRRFILEPNVAVWARDFAEMKAAGVNIVRTGIWTGFRGVMPEPGSPDEGIMRALTAFMLTAAKYDMTVILTLFAFTPHGWEGTNPYLDPRCLHAQKEYVAALAWRLSKFNNLMWDLINEPSFPSQGRPWTCRPNHDQFEEAAWREWVKNRHGSGDELTEAWRITTADAAGLPAALDFEDRQIYQNANPMKALDYRLFAQDVFNRWIREMSAVIRQNGNPKQLITVGQDEGGNSDRPNPQFHYRDVDFTCQHTWWMNDDLLWDGLMSNTPDKPNLVEETGCMFVEQPDRSARRSEEDCRDLLERKFVMAFASGAAGVIQWVWNTNTYMSSDNEVAIGLHRADLTRKPEYEVFPGITAFIREARPYFTKRRLEDVCMVIPHSGMFSIRDPASTATRVCVRLMHYHCRVPMRAVGEYALENLGQPRLIMLPCPRVLSQAAWETLLKAVSDGAVLLITGPIESDEYWRPVDRLSEFEIETSVRPVTREEETIIFGTQYRLSFGGEKIHRIDKATIGRQSGMVKTVSHGSGKLVYAPLPFELADNLEPTVALYEFALRQAVIEPPFDAGDKDPSVLIRPQFFDKAVFYCVVSETDEDKEFSLTDKTTGRTLEVRVPGQRAIMFVLDNAGRVVAEYGGGVVKDGPEVG